MRKAVRQSRAKLDWHPVFSEGVLRDRWIKVGIICRNSPVDAELTNALEQSARRFELWHELCRINQDIETANAAKREAVKALDLFIKQLAVIECETNRFLVLAQGSKHEPSVVSLRARLDEIGRLHGLATHMKQSDVLIQNRNPDRWVEYGLGLYHEYDRIIRLVGTTKYDGGFSDDGPMAHLFYEVIPRLTGEHPGNEPHNKKM